ncbi:hypothetical protein M011DRAFT_458060 [Sporormia fimetaria CBS 119925]|uniref:PAC domain-containing protein n=1 Tax=Sporormia fimetaria CBS 119925 TaxID=1340428 RepID=A0A6A6VF40_9PLEO|nr:hypothetical protein M011DRAFT_458060 [Sporormia fimetaria CBS 119925]
MSDRPCLISRPSSPTLSVLTDPPTRDLPPIPQTPDNHRISANTFEIPHHVSHRTTSEDDAFDLAPPPPRRFHVNAEEIAERLFSAEHLDVILKDASLSSRFTNFLNRYLPRSVPTLVRYMDAQKASAALRYANSLAEQVGAAPQRASRRSSKRDTATVDPSLEAVSRKALDDLVGEALPAYVTYRMVDLVTEVLVKEIVGNNTPLMREMVQGLAEVYCMSDPSLPDNPIVFASEEFYHTTHYAQDYVIGKNCRFLQGPKTQQQAIRRISTALHHGEEVSEILLNYRRDGSSFLNLVMTAPLMDHHGKVRYFIGCQIDITNLLEGGRGLDSFKQLLNQDEIGHRHVPSDPLRTKPSLDVLRELRGLLNDDEIEIVRDPNRGELRTSIDSDRASTRTPHPGVRRYLNTDDRAEHPPWPPSQCGLSGKLPGVYQNYLLVRPYPSLRIIFTSPSLRIPGLSKSHLMSRIGGPQHVREGLLEAFSQGTGVTAKISWLTHHAHTTSTSSNSTLASQSDRSSVAGSDVQEGKPRWIHCTPLLGSDSKPGVWMVVMVDKEEITGSLRKAETRRSTIYARDDVETGQGVPLRGLDSAEFTSGKLYQEYLRRVGRSEGDLAGMPR